MDTNTVIAISVGAVVGAAAGYFIYSALFSNPSTAGLPPRGTGLITGRVGERRSGYPRTDEERMIRHYSSFA